MKFFWPYLSNKNPDTNRDRTDRTPFHFVASSGLSDVADFMLEELKKDSKIEILKNVRLTSRKRTRQMDRRLEKQDPVRKNI